MIRDLANGDWFCSRTGNPVWPFDLNPEDVVPEDIASSLSKLCRFNGHCRRFYSVAEHSVHVSSYLPFELARVGLMHDATEAFCGDLIRPIKREMPAFVELEESIWRAIAARFSLPLEIPPQVKRVDRAVLLSEARWLLPKKSAEWFQLAFPDDNPMSGLRPVGLGPPEAEVLWWDLFCRLFPEEKKRQR